MGWDSTPRSCLWALPTGRAADRPARRRQGGAERCVSKLGRTRRLGRTRLPGSRRWARSCVVARGTSPSTGTRPTTRRSAAETRACIRQSRPAGEARTRAHGCTCWTAVCACSARPSSRAGAACRASGACSTRGCMPSAEPSGSRTRTPGRRDASRRRPPQAAWPRSDAQALAGPRGTGPQPPPPSHRRLGRASSDAHRRRRSLRACGSRVLDAQLEGGACRPGTLLRLALEVPVCSDWRSVLGGAVGPFARSLAPRLC